MIDWPFACPKTWTEKPKPSIIRSEVDDGFPKVRRRFTKSWKEIEVTFMLNWSYKDQFDNFFETDCAAGAEPFYLDDPYNGNQLKVRWKEAPVTSGSPDMKPYFTVSGTLEVIL